MNITLPNTIERAGRVACSVFWAFGLLMLLPATVQAQNSGDSFSESLPEFRRVYVPISELDRLLERDRKGVLLTRARFNELLRAVAGNRQTIRPTLVQSTESELEFAGNQAIVRTTIGLRQFNDRWQTCLLPLPALPVESASVNGEPARLGRNEQGLILLHKSAGSFEALVEQSAGITFVGSDQVIGLSFPDPVAGALTVLIPEGKQLLANGLRIPRPSDGRARIPLGNQPQLSLQLTDDRKARSADSLVFASSAIGIQVAPGELSWQTRTRVSLFGQTLNQLEFSVPSALEIADVEATGLESWELVEPTDAEDRTIIQLTFRQPIDGIREITMRGISTIEVEKPWTVPNLELSGTTSHNGQILIRYPHGTRLVQQAAEGIRRSESGDVSGYVGDSPERAESTLVFDIWQEDFQLEFVTQTKRREVQANISNLLEVSDRGADLETLASLECRYAPLFGANLELSADWQISGIFWNDRPIPWKVIPREAGRHHLQVEFPEPLVPGAATTLRVTSHLEIDDWPMKTDEVEFELPSLEIKEAATVDGTCLLKADESLDLVLGSSEGLVPTFLGLDGERSSFTYQGTEYSATLKVTRRPSRLIVRGLAVARIDPEAMRTYLESNLEVTGGGLTSLDVQLPDTVSSSLRFELLSMAESQTVQISEQNEAEPVNGSRTWTLKFDQRLHGQHVLHVMTEVSESNDGQWTVPVLLVPAAVQQSGYVAIEADSEQQLQINAVDESDKPLPVVDPLDLPNIHSSFRPKERIVAAYRHVKSRAAVRIGEQRLDQIAVPTAVGDRLQLTSVIGRNGQLLTRADLSFRAVGTQGIRVQLEAGALLWASLLDDQPIEVRRKADSSFVVPLPPAASAESIRHLSLFYETRIEDRLSLRGSIRQTPPLLTVDSTGSERAEMLEVLQANWTIQYPDDVRLTESRGVFHPDSDLQQGSLLGAWQQQFEVPPWEELETPLENLGWILLILVFLGAMIRRWRWKGVLGLVCVGAVIGCLSLYIQEFSASGNVGWDSSVSETSRAMPTASPVASNMLEDFEADMGLANEFKAEMADEAVEMPTAEAETPSDDESVVMDQPKAQAPGGFDDLSQVGNAMDSQSGEEANRDAGGEAFNRIQPKARLSVRFDLPDPAGSRRQSFSYLGSVGLQQSRIEVEFENLGTSLALRSTIAFGVMLFLIVILRKRSRRTRAVCSALAIFGPLVLITFLPLRYHLMLDGVLIGAAASLLVSLLFRIGTANWGRICRMPITRRSIARLILFFLLTGMQTIEAADPPAKKQAASPASATDQAADNRTIFIPYEDGSNPLDSSQVFLPHAIFLKLWNQANPEAVPARNVKIPGMVSGVVHVGSMTSDAGEPAVRFRSRFVIHSFRSAPIQLDLPLGEVSLNSATLDGNTAAVMIGQGPSKPEPASQQTKQQTRQFAVLIPESGSHVLDLEFDVPLRQQGPAGQFRLPLFPVASGKLSFQLPSPNLEVSVNNRRGTYRRRTEGDLGWIDVPVDSGGLQTIAWNPRASRDTMNIITHGTTSAVHLIDDAGIHLRSLHQLQVRQGALNSVQFRLSDDARLQSIRGPDVGGWELGELPEGRGLTVYLRRTVDDQTSIQIELFQEMEIGDSLELGLPVCEPLQITRESGQLAVFPESHFRVRPITNSGLRQVNTDSFKTDDALRLPPRSAVLAYQFQSRPVELRVAIERREAEGAAQALHAASIERRRTLISSRLRVTLQGAPRSRYVVRLPYDFTPLDVTAADLADWFVTETDTDTLAVLEMQSARTGVVEISIQGTVPRQPDEDFAEVDVPQLLGIERLQANLGIWFDETYSANLDEVEGWRSVPTGQLSREITRLEERPPQFGFSTTELETYPISFTVKRRQPRLQGDVVSLINVFDTSVDYALNLKWTLQNAPSDQFVFSGPAWLENSIDLRADGIREVRTEALDDDRMRWTITTREPRSEQFYVLGTVTLPPPVADTGILVPEILLEEVSADDPEDVRPLESLRAFVVLVNQSPDQIQLSEEDSTSDPVELDALPIEIPRELANQAAYMLRLKNPRQLPQWTIRQVTPSLPTPASVNFADLVTVVAVDGSWRTQATYRTRNRLRQFLPVLVPDGARVLSTYVAGKPVRPVQQQITVEGRDQAVFLVAMPATSAADTSFEIRIVFAGQLESLPDLRLLNITGSELELPVPRIVSIDQSKNYGVPVMQTRWNLYLPEEWNASLVDSPESSNVTEQSSVDAEYLADLALVNDARELLNVLSDGSSATQNYKAYNNLVDLQSQLEQKAQQANLQSQPQSGITDNRRQLERENRELKIKLSELSRNLVIDQDQQRIMTSPETGGKERLGEERQRRSVERQNDFLFGNNGVIDSPASKSVNGTINRFRFEVQRQPKEETAKKLSGKDSAAPADNMKRTNRLKQLEKNYDQLRKQNDKSNAIRQNASGNSGVPEQSNNAPPLPGFGGVAGGFGGRADSASDRMTGSRGRSQGQVPQAAQPPLSTDPFSDGLPAPPDFAARSSASAQNQNGQFGQKLSLDLDQTQQVESGQGFVAWSQAGGLSLDIEIPVGGRQMTFTKVGGGPRATLRIRNDELLTKSFGIGWSATWLIVGLIVLRTIRESGQRGWVSPMATILFVIGIMLFFGYGSDGQAIGVPLMIGSGLLVILRMLVVRPKNAVSPSSQ